MVFHYNRNIVASTVNARFVHPGPLCEYSHLKDHGVSIRKYSINSRLIWTGNYSDIISGVIYEKNLLKKLICLRFY